MASFRFSNCQRRTGGVGVAIIVAVVLVGCRSAPRSAPSPAPNAAAPRTPSPVASTRKDPRVRSAPAALTRRMKSPAHLSPQARALVAQQMRQHGDEMTVLLWAMLFLDLSSAGELAESIATAPRIARPTATDPNDVNAGLPERFFELQDELGERAAALAEMSRSGMPEPELFAEAYGRLAQTCVRCHTVYLRERPQGAGPGAAGAKGAIDD